ncbi:NAD(P)/FAD-dependent oxidoreductase [Nocardia callitridis]|uniref:NAD(P)/FAD-dependent oxidoreductase n=1 Tax=Nocardia callitridis TaxID=648753 RepID=A0ABP9L4I5_9NOCA
MSETQKNYDVVIVGGGPAGLSAALVLARARRKVAVVRGGPARNAPSRHMHGFLTRDGMAPSELIETGVAEAASVGAELVDDFVAEVENHGDTADFTVRLTGGPRLRTRKLLVTTGLRDELPELPGVREQWGTDVLGCPYCDGYEVRDQPIAVLGGSEPGALARAVHLALMLPQWSRDLTFFPHTMTLSDADRARLDARGVRVVDGEVARLAVTDGRVRGVELVDGSAVARTAVFVATTFIPNNRVLADLRCELDDGGWVRVDAFGRTSVDGVWAAGNVTNPAANVIASTAAGSGAAMMINADLVEAEVASAVEAAAVGAR